jgi:uncharacterized coiled-coil protein SlyX
MLPDGIHIRTEGVARYVEVSTTAVRRLTDRYQDELTENGMRVLRGPELRSFHSDILSPWKEKGREGPESYPQAATQLRLYTRRTVLNVAMLLRDSDIARCVRTYLLDAEQDLRAGHASLEHRVTRVESCLAGVGITLQELGPVLNRISHRLDSLDRRLDATHQVVGAMSVRLGHMSEDIVRIDGRMDDLACNLKDLSRRNRQR